MSSTNVLHYKQCREKIYVSFQLSFQSFEIIKVHWLNVTDLVSRIPASSQPLENLQVISSCSSTSRFNGAFSLPLETENDTASLLSKAFENSILVEVSGRWYFCKDLTSLYPVRCITNLSGFPFLMLELLLLHGGCGWWIGPLFLRLCKAFSQFLQGCHDPTGEFPYQTAK